jgi:CrcB protein
MNYLIVFIGAGIGGALRHGVNSVSARLLGIEFPWGTLAVNILGSLIMGLLAGYFAFKGEAVQAWRLLAGSRPSRLSPSIPPCFTNAVPTPP